ncbi:MAG: hypothetical protein HQ494_01070 [Rhodospirillales bacterium]|nr:hypothetical protein [Rhodospirillales bacterium]
MADFKTDPRAAKLKDQGTWVGASGGTESSFTSRSGIRMLYCWNPTTRQHAYLNLDTDIIMTQPEVDAALALN